MCESLRWVHGREPVFSIYNVSVTYGRHIGVALEESNFRIRVKKYYELVGWDDSGRPSSRTTSDYLVSPFSGEAQLAIGYGLNKGPRRVRLEILLANNAG